MAISQALCTVFKQDLMDAGQDLTSATLKIALYTSSATLDGTTTAYSTSDEVTGTGYTAGGETLTNVVVATDGTTAYLDCDNVSWSSATITARGALIYNNSNSNSAICVLDFTTDKSSSNGTFEIQFPAPGASTALIRIA